MTDPKVFEYSDRGGGLEAQTADHDPVTSVPFWSTARQLMTQVIFQASGSIDTSRHPVWSLQAVEVEGTPYWCFALQAGMNSALGAAGGCQFMFCNARLLPSEVWTMCTARAAGGRLGDAAGDGFASGTGDVDQPGVESTLRALYDDRVRIALPGEPSYAARHLTALLRVLPAQIVAERLWTTCLLQPPANPALRVVAGRLPEEFRRQDPQGAVQLDQWFDYEDEPGAGPTRSQQEKDAVAFLAAVAVGPPTGRPVASAESSVTTMTGLVQEVVDEQLEITPHDVPRLLRSADGRRRLVNDQSQAVHRWAGTKPDAARALLLAPRGPMPEELERQLLFGLMDATETTGRNLVGLPGGERTEPRWPNTLHSLLLRHSQLKDLVPWLIRIGAGTLDVTESGSVERRAFLRRLGVDRTMAPQLHPFDPARAVGSIAAGRGLTQQTRDELRHSVEPDRDVHVLISALGEIALRALSPEDAIELVRAASRSSAGAERRAVAVEVVGRLTLARADAEPRTAARWTEDLIVAMRLVETSIREAVAMAAAAALGKSVWPLPGGVLVAALRTMEQATHRGDDERWLLQTVRTRLGRRGQRRRVLSGTRRLQRRAGPDGGPRRRRVRWPLWRRSAVPSSGVPAPPSTGADAVPSPGAGSRVSSWLFTVAFGVLVVLAVVLVVILR